MIGRTFAGSLAGASFTFTSDAADLFDYAVRHLAPLAGPAGAAPAVSAVLRWHDAQPPRERPQDPAVGRVDRIDRDLYVTGDILQWFRVDDLRDLHLRFSWTPDRLTIEGDFYYRLGNRWFSDRVRRLSSWRQRAWLRQRRFTTLLYYLVYYPCWWWLESMRDLHPIHAAGVQTTSGAILLAGASGVGKSSLAMALAATPGARLLADSFVVHNAADVLPVREPILLDDWSQRWLGAGASMLKPIDWHYGLNRRGYLVAAERWAESGQAALLLFPRRSSESYVAAMAPETAHQRLSSLNLIINDLRRYFAFAAVLEQLVPRGLVAQRETQLARLVGTVPAYEIGMTAAATAAATVASIEELRRDQRQRAVNAGAL